MKLKSFLWSEQTFTALLICVVGVVAFMLGQQSAIIKPSSPQSGTQSAGVVFIDTQNASTSPWVVGEQVQVVASRSGTKYHLLTCSGAKTIKESNKIYFDSIDQAKAAGYGPAANCEGLR